MTTSGVTSSAPATAQSTNAQALTSLGSNLNDFLNLLMTQLQNQDPTQPLDTNQFTSQLVQFASVEQQINANTNLTSLIQLTQGGQMLQANSLIGKTVTAQSDTLALQNGHAQLKLNPTASGPVNVTILSTQGVQLASAVVQASPGGTAWSWNGTTSSGQSLPNGAYKVTATDANGSAVPFDVIGTVTGVQQSGTGVMANLGGGLQVSLASIQSMN